MTREPQDDAPPPDFDNDPEQRERLVARDEGAWTQFWSLTAPRLQRQARTALLRGGVDPGRAAALVKEIADDAATKTFEQVVCGAGVQTPARYAIRTAMNLALKRAAAPSTRRFRRLGSDDAGALEGRALRSDPEVKEVVSGLKKQMRGAMEAWRRDLLTRKIGAARSFRGSPYLQIAILDLMAAGVTELDAIGVWIGVEARDQVSKLRTQAAKGVAAFATRQFDKEVVPDFCATEPFAELWRDRAIACLSTSEVAAPVSPELAADRRTLQRVHIDCVGCEVCRELRDLPQSGTVEDVRLAAALVAATKRSITASRA